MSRRDFLKLVASVGLVGTMPALFRDVSASGGPFTGPILVTIHAGGGWDQSSFSDPRENPSINHWADNNPAGIAGNLRFAPFAENAAFFGKYFQDTLVLNGIDIQSNGHGSADRNRSTGSLMQGLPTLNELYAGIHGQGMAMPFVRGGGFAETAGILPFTNLPDENLLRTLTNPNALADGRHFHKPSDIDKVRAYRLDRLQAQREHHANTWRTQNNLDSLYTARTAGGGFGGLMGLMPNQLDTQDLQGTNNNLVRQMHLFLIIASAGMTATGSFSTGGFDTHGDHDARHTVALTRLTRAVDYLWTKAADLGLADRLVVHITSDVGRTPHYNANNGKDHWSAGSDIIMRQGAAWANRIVGATGPKHEKRSIDPTTLALNEQGIRITPKHVYNEMRKMLGIDQHGLAQRYPLSVEDVAIFNPAVATGIEV